MRIPFTNSSEDYIRRMDTIKTLQWYDNRRKCQATGISKCRKDTNRFL